ncbi:MAG: hypothetical protein RI909_636 [Bacteroidota bacterium]|jgi:uncharacterized membrane protein YhaH (DUF805 family)
MFKSPFSFDGRIRRTEYGISFIIYIIFYFVALTLMDTGGTMETMLALIIIIPLVWFLWAQGAKRCHDLGKTGWFQIIPFYFLWLLFVKGDADSNEYGSNSKSTRPPLVKTINENAPDAAPPGLQDQWRR